MAECGLMAKLSKNLINAKHESPCIPIGGLDMFFFGDFTHFPPVKDTPLYHRFSSKTVKNSTSQTDVLCNLGLALWQHLTHVALLTQ